MRAHAAPMFITRQPGWRLRGLPFVAMMKAADLRNLDDRRSGSCRDWSGIRRAKCPRSRPTWLRTSGFVVVM